MRRSNDLKICIRCASKRSHFSALHIFHLKVLKDPEKKISLESKQMATKGKQKNDHNPEAGVVGSLATLLSETSHDDVDTVGEGPGKGSLLLPSPRAPLVTRPSPPSRQDPGVGGRGTSPKGTALPTAEPGEGHGCRHSSHPARRPERGPRDRSYRSHPHTHPSCGPARPPAPHRGRPKSHREPRKRPWGAGRERGADPRAHTGRKALHKDLGPADASTQTQ